MFNPVSILKEQHRRGAFSLLFQRRELTRTDIAAELGVSVQTAVKIMKYFVDYGFAECIGEGSGALGRKPLVYAPIPNCAFILGIVHEGSVIHAGVCNLSLELLVMQTAEMRSSIEEVIITQTCEITAQLIKKLESIGYKNPFLIGLGLGLPGVIDDKKSEVSFAPSLSISSAYNISPMLEKLKQRLKMHVIIENDVNAAVLGEHKEGSDLAFLSIGSGVGMGLVLDGKLRRGARCMAGEVAGIKLCKEEISAEDIIGLNALRKSWGFDRRFGLLAMPFDIRNKMLETIADISAHILVASVCILDVENFVVGGLTPSLMREDLFVRIEEKAQRLTSIPISIRQQSVPCPALIGVCKKMLNERLEHLLCMDSEYLYNLQ